MHTFQKMDKGRKFVFWLSLIALFEFVYPHTVVAKIRTEPDELKITVSSVVINRPPSQARLPEIADRPAKKVVLATVTAYSSSVDETDSDPFTTASGAKTHQGVVAYNYLPFGTKIRIPEKYGNTVFVVADRLRAGASRYHFDVWMPSKAEAKQWGVKMVKIEIL